MRYWPLGRLDGTVKVNEDMAVESDVSYYDTAACTKRTGGRERECAVGEDGCVLEDLEPGLLGAGIDGVSSRGGLGHHDVQILKELSVQYSSRVASKYVLLGGKSGRSAPQRGEHFCFQW